MVVMNKNEILEVVRRISEKFFAVDFLEDVMREAFGGGQEGFKKYLKWRDGINSSIMEELSLRREVKESNQQIPFEKENYFYVIYKNDEWEEKIIKASKGDVDNILNSKELLEYDYMAVDIYRDKIGVIKVISKAFDFLGIEALEINKSKALEPVMLIIEDVINERKEVK